jgi:hypothetical protein
MGMGRVEDSRVENADVRSSLFLVTLAVLTCGLTNGCTSSGQREPPPGPPPGGTIVGHLVLAGGPTNPKRPVPGSVKYVGGIGQTGSAGTVDVGADGRFELSVLPGAYSLSGRSPMYHVNGQEGVCRHAGRVEVASGQAVRADIYCEMKYTPRR